ncbi:MAG TPA: hypothetical protein ENO05_12985 [Bacteroides sp.]|nr:hypothetical protein [Bacteroides sp.]
MNNLFTYLLELNMAMVILYAGYKLFFERDRNFLVRRLYLLATIIIPVLLILLPDTARSFTGRLSPLVIHLDQVTVTAYGQAHGAGGSLSPWSWLMILYLSVATLGMTRMMIQLVRIRRAVKQSARLEMDGVTLYANPGLHASSFFSYIFMDPARVGQESFNHILEHELFHKRGWHSADRILAELVVIIHWFNPVAWLLRRSVIENLEYLTDSAMVEKGTDLRHYQLSLLNQYMGSASITNQFNSQIKNRIKMLNKNYKQGSIWKLAMIFPLAFMTMFFFSCTDKDQSLPAVDENQEQSILEGEVFYIVEEMPTFNGGEPATEFRKYIAQNVRYPVEAAKNGATGKVYINFVVTREGKVVIPEKEELAKISGKALDEVVVVAYGTISENDPRPEEKYIDLLKEEVIRVVSTSPDWSPGRQRGKAVNVIYTFPVNFVLQ